MQYLIDNTNGFPPRKQQLVEATHSTSSYIANELAVLTKAGYVKESKGYYAITPEGIRAQEEDPILIALRNGFQGNKSRSPNNSVDSIINWDYINNNRLCQEVINAEFEDNFNFNRLLPIVLIYLEHAGYPIPTKLPKEEMTAPNKTYDRELDLLNSYITSLSRA